MSNPLKKIGKTFKSVAKTVKKVFKSPIFKAVAIGAAAFFALPIAATAMGVGAGAAGGAAAGGGAGAWWSSTLGLGGAGTAATTAANAAGTAALGSTGAAAAGGAAGGVGVAGFGAPTAGMVSGQYAAMKAATPAWMQAAGAAAGNVGTQKALANAAVQTGTETGKQGLLGKAVSGFKGLDSAVQAGLINTAGQGISGWASAKQAEKDAERKYQLELEMQERMWAREDELQNRKSIFGKRYDGSGGYDYNIGNLMYASDGKQSFGNFVGSSPGQKKEKDIFAGYNPYWSA